MARTQTEKREHPILFSSEMVNAILDGRKTRTRRVITSRNSTVPGQSASRIWDQLHFDYDQDGLRNHAYGPNDSLFGANCQYLHVPTWHSGDGPDDACMYRLRPRIQPGDILWIKTSYSTRYDPDIDSTFWSAAGRFITTRHQARSSTTGRIKRDGKHSGIFMPNWLSQELRLPRLEVTGVRVERLQDIDYEEIQAEGSECCDNPDHGLLSALPGEHGRIGCPVCGHDPEGYALREFAKLWDSINGTPKPKYETTEGGKKVITHYESYPWSDQTRDPREEINGVQHLCFPNTWVWAYEFKRVEGTT